MSITERSIKILWAAAGGRCAFPNCSQQLCFGEAGEFAPFTLGEMAHICGEKPGSNRHNPAQTPRDRDDYLNLILLCPNHHTLIDRKENEEMYSVGVLRQMKVTHEEAIITRLASSNKPNRIETAKLIAPLLAENYRVWSLYGPRSELAKRNPHSDAAYAVWVSERLSVIVPNNRQICELLTDMKVHYDVSEQSIVSSFLIHARSYERWVNDEVSYEAVLRFPNAFAELIEGIANASS